MGGGAEGEGAVCSPPPKKRFRGAEHTPTFWCRNALLMMYLTIPVT